MSKPLESLAGCARREECARTDAMYGITHTCPIMARGRHLSDAANEPNTFRDVYEAAQADARAILRGVEP